MKTYKLEICGFDDRDARAALYELARQCQYITNRIWQLWETWHVANGSREKLVAGLEADRAWRETPPKERGERPKFPVDCLPKVGGKNRLGNAQTLRNQIEAEIGQTFPGVHSRIRSLIANKAFRGITSRKAASGKLKGWQAILLNHESRPSFTHPLPIPFDRQHSQIVPGAKGEPAELAIRLERNAAGQSVPRNFRLLTSGRAARYVKPIVRIASGEWDFKGSALAYDSRKKKWFAMLACELPPGPKTESVPGRTAFFRCGRDVPVQLRIAGERVFLRNFGRGGAIPAVRRQLLTQRWSRQNNYRVAGSANKGHGRTRALGPVFLLSQRWKDFTKRYNHTLTTAFVDRCRREGVAKVIYFQPTGGRFFDTAGKLTGREDATGWDYFQIKTFLADKCQEAGIEFVCRKAGASRDATAGLVGVG